MARSLIIFEVESYAEVKALVENDVYWTGDVVRVLRSPIAWLLRFRMVYSGTRRRQRYVRGCLPSRFNDVGMQGRIILSPGCDCTTLCSFVLL